MFVIEVENLTKEFTYGFLRKHFRALDKINLEIKEGEIFGYLGPNGAGKTTTLKIIVGLLYPTAGSVKLFGESPLNPKVKERIGFLPENPYFYDYLTIQEYLELCLQLFDFKKKNVKSVIDEVLEVVELKQAKDTQCRKLSKGMLQRLGIAQTLINDPQVLILDEPLTGLDPIGRKSIRDLLLNLRKMGKTIFLSSHIISDLEMLCDRVAIIVNGEIRNVGTLADLVEDKIKYIEIIAEDLSGDCRSKIKNITQNIILFGNRTSIRVVKKDDVSKVIDLIRQENSRIFSVNPVRYSLEDTLVRELH